MVKYLLDRDEWELYNCRCIGSFFAAFDQSEARSDVQDSEVVQINLKTNYKGNTYKWCESDSKLKYGEH